MGLTLTNDNQEIELIIKGYQFPQLTKYFSDNNWLTLSCRSITDDKTICGEFPCFMTMELQRLQVLLEQFQSGVLASVSWNGTEPNFSITLHENRLLNIFFDAENGDSIVTFCKYATVQDVKNLIIFCAESSKLYPVREFGL